MGARRRLPLLVVALAVTTGTATACTDVSGTEGKDDIEGGGLVREIPEGDRKGPVEVSGETLDR